MPQDGLVYQPVVCELVEATVASGKYAGQHCVRSSCGRRIGQLSQTMSDRYAHLLDGDTRAACETFARRTGKGVDAKLRLPEIASETTTDR